MRFPRAFFKLAVVALIALAPALAEAKMGAGFFGGMGSRGSRTFSAPPSTSTAPGPAAPIQRSVTPQGSPSSPLGGPSFSSPAQRPFAALPPATGSFGRSLLGGLAGGLLGAGLFGMLTGHGFFGGMGGFVSIIGLLIQIAVIAFAARLAFAWWMNRNTAVAGDGPRLNRAPFSSFGFSGLQAGSGSAAPRPAPIRLANEDFAAFERLLGESQDAYSREDVARLRNMATPEIVCYLEAELAANRAKGVVNRVSNVKLLQGDLSEAWREGSDEYATVAMRFAHCDVMEDLATRKVVSGDPSAPVQSVEVWTFRRPASAGADAWKLSAIQVTADNANSGSLAN